MRGVRFRRAPYSYVDAEQILSSLGLNNSDELKDLMMDFTEESTDSGDAKKTADALLTEISIESGDAKDILKTENLQKLVARKRQQNGM